MSDPKCPPKTRRAGVAAKPKAPTLHEPVSVARVDPEWMKFGMVFSTKALKVLLM